MEKKILTAVFAILIAVCGWVFEKSFEKLTNIEKELINLRLDVVQVQNSILTEEKVRDMITEELELHELKQLKMGGR